MWRGDRELAEDKPERPPPALHLLKGSDTEHTSEHSFIHRRTMLTRMSGAGRPSGEDRERGVHRGEDSVLTLRAGPGL